MNLTAVADASGNPAGFADGNTSGADYTYWPEGSIRKDLNRGISEVQYNLLKLPSQVSFTSGKVVRYQYDASGRKLRMNVVGGEQRDYLTQSEYANGAFAFQTTPQGRVTAGEVYEYFLRDHLGNVRAIVRDSAGVAVLSQRTDYDPWGLELAGLGYQRGSQPNRYTFNGKESLSELGPNFVDFGARGYDATIGRMHQVDAASEVFTDVSPFSFGLNNPVMNVDPTGDTTVPYQQVNMKTFDTKTNDIGLNAVTITGQRQTGGSGGGGGSAGGWLMNESGQRINQDGSPRFDPNRFNYNLFIRPNDESNEGVELADNLLAIFSPIKALQGLMLMAKINPFSKPIAIKKLAEQGLLKITAAIRFGKNANQIQHVFRHTDELGLSRSVVESAVKSNLSRLISQIEPGKPFNRVIEISGKRIQYTAFKLGDGTVNVGRIHGTP